AVPVFARVDTQLGGRVRRLAEHVEGVLDVLRGERLAVVPFDALAQEEHEIAVVVLPRPLLGQLTDDGVHALRLLQRIEEHEVAQTRHHGPRGRDGRRLVDREALRQIFALRDVQRAAGLRRLTDGRCAERDDEHEADDGERYRYAHA